MKGMWKPSQDENFRQHGKIRRQKNRFWNKSKSVNGDETAAAPGSNKHRMEKEAGETQSVRDIDPLSMLANGDPGKRTMTEGKGGRERTNVWVDKKGGLKTSNTFFLPSLSFHPALSCQLQFVYK